MLIVGGAGCFNPSVCFADSLARVARHSLLPALATKSPPGFLFARRDLPRGAGRGYCAVTLPSLLREGG